MMLILAHELQPGNRLFLENMKIIEDEIKK